MSARRSVVPGPYEDERTAYRDFQTAHPERFADAVRRPGGGWQRIQYEALLDACQAARVPLGAWDVRVLVWLAQWEPETVQVVIGLVLRANVSR